MVDHPIKILTMSIKKKIYKIEIKQIPTTDANIILSKENANFPTIHTYIDGY